MRYDESDNIVIRASRIVTDKIIDIVGMMVTTGRDDVGWNVVFVLGGVFSPSETSQTFAEIAKIDSTFDKEKFIALCESQIIPTVLEVHLSVCLCAIFLWLDVTINRMPQSSNDPYWHGTGNYLVACTQQKPQLHNCCSLPEFWNWLSLNYLALLAFMWLGSFGMSLTDTFEIHCPLKNLCGTYNITTAQTPRQYFIRQYFICSRAGKKRNFKSRHHNPRLPETNRCCLNWKQNLPSNTWCTWAKTEGTKSPWHPVEEMWYLCVCYFGGGVYCESVSIFLCTCVHGV